MADPIKTVLATLKPLGKRYKHMRRFNEDGQRITPEEVTPEETSDRAETILDFGTSGKVKVIIEKWIG